jgi:glyoxylase-like metal-dependent hydrolase (beta-lactamase superfamily II)
MELMDGLYALRYGKSVYSEAAVFKDGVKDRNVDFHWVFFMLSYGGRTIVVDPGFDDPKYIGSFGVEWTDPVDLLGRIGVSPGKTDVLLLTHHHFDHVGLIHRFSGTRVVISKAARKAVTYPKAKAFLKNADSVEGFSGRIEVMPGLVMEEIGGHVAGSSIVRISAPGKGIVLTGDEAYVAANWTAPRTNGSCRDPEANTAFLKRLKAEVDAGETVAYSMHDPALIPGADPVLKLW